MCERISWERFAVSPFSVNGMINGTLFYYVTIIHTQSLALYIVWTWDNMINTGHKHLYCEEWNSYREHVDKKNQRIPSREILIKQIRLKLFP